MAEVILVNPFVPGQIKQDRVANIGLLAVATALSKEFSVKIVDHYSNPWVNLSDMVEANTIAVGFSCSGAESFRTSVSEVRNLKLVFPELFLFVGGQHVTGLYQAGILPLEVPEINCFLPGPGERTVKRVLRDLKQGRAVERVVVGEDISAIEGLDYTLYPDWKSLIPCVEIGRGCNHSCHFCNSENMRQVARYIIRDEANVCREVETILSDYGEDTDLFLFGSIFGEDTRQTGTILERLSKLAPKAKYTFNLRTDCNWQEFIEPLTRLTVRSVFFGMESASEQILSHMNKTRDPARYLAKSRTIFQMFSELHIPFFTSFILGYWGESTETIQETVNFIAENAAYLKAIGVNRYYIYPGSYDFSHIDQLAQEYQSVVSFSPELQIYWIEQSSGYSGAEIEKLCQKLEDSCNDPVYLEKVRNWRFRI